MLRFEAWRRYSLRCFLLFGAHVHDNYITTKQAYVTWKTFARPDLLYYDNYLADHAIVNFNNHHDPCTSAELAVTRSTLTHVTSLSPQSDY